MGPIGGTEILIILGIVVLLFGSTAIPKVAKSIGLAKREFEKGMNDSSQDVIEEVKEETKNKKLKKIDKLNRD